MRVLFIDPPFQRFMGFHRYYYPLGLAYMAAVLQRQGHSVKIYDAEHTTTAQTLPWSLAAQRYDEYPKALKNEHHPVWDEVKNILSDFKPDVVGISTLSVKASSASRIAEICKQFNDSISVIVGADHPTVFPEQTLHDPNIDIVVRGEGESTIVELISALEKGRNEKVLDSVAGISYKSGEKIKHTPNRELLANLDDLPFPAIATLVDYHTYRAVDFGAIMASRGCPYPCAFCGVFNIWTRKVRFRSSSSVVNEMLWLKETYGTHYFSFRDASFTINRDRIITFCYEILQQDLKIEWECLTRADLLDDELLNLMKKSGCVTVRLGIESGSEQVLRYMKKEIDLNITRKVAKLLHKHDMYWSAYLLFGTPVETQETIKETLDFVKEINPPFVTLSRFAPIPGTEIYKDLVRAGLISSDIDWNMESNQQFRSNYVFSMNKDEFEKIMREITQFIESLNDTNSAKMKMRDSRLKSS